MAKKENPLENQILRTESPKEKRAPIQIMFGFRIVLALVLLVWSRSALADPAWISSGGAVHQLTENKSVTMQSEIVNIQVSKYLVTVDCRCTFVNNGPACKIRMGFPEGRSGGVPFLSYKSSINGKEVKTEIVRDNGLYSPYKVWHANDVEFGAAETKIVCDTYTSIPGWMPASFPYNGVEYVLSTASSWHGPIRKADIVFMFDKDALPQPLHAASIIILPNGQPDYQSQIRALATPGTFVYKASKAPKINGQIVHFEFTDLHPSKKDDIVLSYGHMSSSEAHQFIEMVRPKLQEKPAPY